MHKRNKIVIKHVGTWVLIMLLAQMSEPIFAQGQYELNWYTIDGGGGISSAGPYTLIGTIGQPDASFSAGDSYELQGGFWLSSSATIQDNFAKVDGKNQTTKNNKKLDFEILCQFANEWLKYTSNSWPLS